jgi:hypothetical protein
MFDYLSSYLSSFFPCFFSSTLYALLFFGPFITSGALIDTLPFKISGSCTLELWGTTHCLAALWLRELSVCMSKLSIALSKSSRISFAAEHFNAIDVAF